MNNYFGGKEIFYFFVVNSAALTYSFSVEACLDYYICVYASACVSALRKLSHLDGEEKKKTKQNFFFFRNSISLNNISLC